jgi:dienelactone hydrolase
MTIPGLKVVVNVSGGLALLNCEKNSDRLVEAMRHYGARSRVPNLWYYAKTDSIFPEETVVKMRAAFLEGGAYAKLVHYPTLVKISAILIDEGECWAAQCLEYDVAAQAPTDPVPFRVPAAINAPEIVTQLRVAEAA